MTTYIGCAGWSIPKIYKDQFAAGSSILAQYSTRLNAVEINSSFYRSHKPTTYQRWAETVPADFKFAVKAPQTITHHQRLKDTQELFVQFLMEIAFLKDKLGPVLIQLPPSLKFEVAIAKSFFKMVRSHYPGSIVLEPRHPTWFTPAASELLHAHNISRVIADPLPVPKADDFGDQDTVYYRFHGSPKIYYSDYAKTDLDQMSQELSDAISTARNVWCIFDNTALGYATGNALYIRDNI